MSKKRVGRKEEEKALSEEFEVIKEKKFEDPITYVCRTKDERLAVSTVDKVIQIINVKNFKTELKLEGHTSWVRHLLVLKNGYLVSSSSEIKIWEIKRTVYNNVKTLSLKVDKGYALKTISIDDNRIGSCCSDNSIKIWNSHFPFSLIKTLTGHNDKVIELLKLKSTELLVSGGGYHDRTIRFWNASTFSCEKVITDFLIGLTGSLLEVGNGLVIAGGWDRSVIVINAITFQVETKIFISKISGYVSFFLHLNDFILFSDTKGNLNQLELHQWKMESVKEKCHNAQISCLLELKNATVLSSSFDWFLKIWKI